MAETKAKRRRIRSGYIHKPGAIHLTLYAHDGLPLSRKVLNEAAEAVEAVAVKYGLLVNVTEG